MKPGLGLKNERLIRGEMSEGHTDVGGFTYVYLHTPLLNTRRHSVTEPVTITQAGRQKHTARLPVDIGTQSHTQMITQRDPSIQGHRYIYTGTQLHSHIQAHNYQGPVTGIGTDKLEG